MNQMSLSKGSMHVFHLINNCNAGGAGYVVLPIIENLQKKGVTFTVAYLKPLESLKPEYERLGVNPIYLGRNPFKIFRQLHNMLKRESDPVTLIHTHLVQASLIGRLMGRIYNIPVMTTRHNRMRSRPFHPLHILEDWTVKFSDTVIAISKSVRSYLLETCGVPPARCQVIYNPLPKEILRGNSKIDIGSNVNIVCNARFINIKGIRYLLDAFEKIAEQIPEAQLLLIGRYSKQSPELERIQDHKFKDRIVLRGFIPRAQVIQELSTARLYVQPSLQEGLGISALEAMGLGCPCILTQEGGLVELADGGNNAVLVPKANSQAIYQSVLELWNDEQRAEKLGLNAKRFIEKHFKASQIADQYFAAYQQLIIK